ncbi:MAG TPA: FKBP-type peptidyl-prolyl cis-trans isomerase [Candidatus Saccharimonadales bacterium]|nr:FKBP-type peptidyl-prolyl cis-trans isomerase [Candidatus Saccharimonadales bacterium]
MTPLLDSLRLRIVGSVAGAALAVLGLGACGSLVPVSSHITPLPPDCSTPRPVSSSDTFTTAPALQPGASGLRFADISVGCGPVAKATSSVTVQFTVWLSTGTLVITTWGANQPVNSLQLANPSTLPFWRVGVPGMRVGGTRQLVVPPALAFGASGNASANVPPNATMVVDVELVSLA